MRLQEGGTEEASRRWSIRLLCNVDKLFDSFLGLVSLGLCYLAISKPLPLGMGWLT